MLRYDLKKQECLQDLVRQLLDCIPTQFELLPAAYIDDAIERFREEQPDAKEPANYIFSEAVENIIADANVKLGELYVQYKRDGTEEPMPVDQARALKAVVEGEGFGKLISWYANGDCDSSVFTTPYAETEEGLLFIAAIIRLEDEFGAELLGWLKRCLSIDLAALLPEAGPLPEEHLTPFEYGGLHFKAEPAFYNAAKDFVSLPERLGAARQVPGGYDYKKFYEAYGHKDCDVFRCLEDNKLYMPCGGNLLQYNE